ncbi:MAG TPA: hypothetical protein VNG90_03850 [Candidatus Acidoferrum sp.]|nr:hypothetical protein [Candidatus Acidoferrum sp.]
MLAGQRFCIRRSDRSINILGLPGQVHGEEWLIGERLTIDAPEHSMLPTEKTSVSGQIQDMVTCHRHWMQSVGAMVISNRTAIKLFFGGQLREEDFQRAVEGTTDTDMPYVAINGPRSISSIFENVVLYIIPEGYMPGMSIMLLDKDGNVMGAEQLKGLPLGSDSFRW